MPPVFTDQGVLVDGAAINNLPVDVMQGHAPGFVIGCDVGADRHFGELLKVDRHGAYPLHGRVCRPSDLCATVYESLGIDPSAEMIDPTGRPILLTRGEPIRELF